MSEKNINIPARESLSVHLVDEDYIRIESGGEFSDVQQEISIDIEQARIMHEWLSSLLNNIDKIQ